MKKHLIAALLIGCLFTVAGCSGVNPSSHAAARTPTPAATSTRQATVEPAEPTAVSPSLPGGATGFRLTPSCDLLNSQDLARLFSSAEVIGPVHQVNQVNHAVFSTESISATESSCIDYVFHRPGSKEEQMLQVTYWIDVPDQAASSAWTQVWADARSKAAQAVSGIGEGAFYDHGRLTFKMGGSYVTIEAVGTYLNTDTHAGVTQQLEIEKQLARDASSRATTA